MTRRKDNKPGSPTSQDALQDYLQQMLSDPSAGPLAPTAETTLPESAAASPIEDSPAREKARPQKKKPSAKVQPKKSKPVADTVKVAGESTPMPQRAAAKTRTEKSAVDQFAAADEQARSIDLQQKLLQARVKDLAEKSVQAAKDQHAQTLQQAQRDAERRERMDAARALVKQRIAARAADHIATDVAAEEDVNEAEPLEAEMVPEAAPEPQLQKPQPWLENGRPVWAQSAFECLLFSVSGLTLAVPLVELGSIYPIQDHLTPIVGQIDWFMGLLHVHNRNHIRTVNTAKIVMPEKYDPAFVDQIRYVISINGYDWGLAVDNVDKAIKLRPDDVRWRTERSKRSWLAGTVVDYMCALVDVQELAVMLSMADHSRPRVRH